MEKAISLNPVETFNNNTNLLTYYHDTHLVRNPFKSLEAQTNKINKKTYLSEFSWIIIDNLSQQFPKIEFYQKLVLVCYFY